MIQRIQSVFLALAALLPAALLFVPLWSKTDPATGQHAALYLWKFVHQKKQELIANQLIWYYLPAVLLSILLSLWALFSYQNRIRQLQINAANTLVLMLLIVGSTYQVTQHYEALFLSSQKGHYYGFFILAATMVFITLANRFIRRDEQLVRSADRIR